MWRRWGYVRQAKLMMLRLLRLQDQPDEIAKGFALGIFVGMTPTLGAQMLIAVFFAMLLRQNKIAAAVAVWISNPLTAPFIYGLEYETGRLLLGMEHVHFFSHISAEAITELGCDLLIPMWFASFLYGAILSTLSYAIVLRMIPNMRKWRITRWPRPFKKVHK
ncbi:MAG: hypothetical protein B6I36_07200 [Desulfobacteraceae bacterium 4572_35.1]|nr:MAG: hypothetical protein B6I36_07200 [Desulfobacteraceae bacterium 4572_35.1]